MCQVPDGCQGPYSTAVTGADQQRAWPGPDPTDITAWTLVQAGHVVGRRFYAAFAEVGLSPTQFGVLLELDLHPGMSNAEIARTVLVTPQSMSELLTSLQHLGLVDRDPPPGRGHRVTTRLTPTGRAALRRCADAVTHVEDSLGLPPEQTNQLNTLLHTTINPTPRRS